MNSVIESNVLKVSATSNPASVAGAIAGKFRDEYAQKGAQATLELRAIGTGAVNQAIKSIAIARGYVATNGINLVCIPAFGEFDVDGEEKSFIRLIVKAEF